MINFLGKNKFENPQIMHRFLSGQTFETLNTLYGPHIVETKNQEVYDGSCVIISGLNENLYVVRPTDTAKSISEKLGIDENVLIKKNGKRFFVGQILKY